ncbi:hypothetical protein CALCODRAFT_509880 [Calocera cornea HHB12733]|uniref:Protein BFR2 n=1 Tax=Calocera cornea HHB12733 TaxID=1353952 RepID=A0A165EYY6_9BASI|nr:hypothetical protein CALCODRAFT_509880 [Calocera cornea HHB12733]
MARLTLAQQIALLDAPLPDIDPEDPLSHTSHAHPAEEDAEAEGEGEGEGEDAHTAHYLPVGRSRLRSERGDPALDEDRFRGVKARRQNLFDSLEFEEEEEAEVGDDAAEEEEEEEDDDDDAPMEQPRTLDGATAAVDVGSEDPAADDGSEDDEDGTEAEPSHANGHLPTAAVPLSSTDGAASPLSAPTAAATPDDLKGLTVSAQLTLHTHLLSSRIALQKLVTSANLLPLPAHLPLYTGHPQAREAVRGLWEELAGMGDELAGIRERLASLNGMGMGRELPARPLKRKRKRPSTTTSDDADADPGPASFANDLAAAHAYHAHLSTTTHPWHLQTLHKWSSKILAVHPGLFQPQGTGGQSRFAQQHSRGGGLGMGEGGGGARGAVEAVELGLREEGKRERGRKGGRRGERRIGQGVGAAPELLDGAAGAADADADADSDQDQDQDQEQETYSDTAFYGSLLRSIIDARSHSGTGTQVQALNELLPNRRSKALKRAVDTRASKGRKLRFEVHERLRHFMVPAPASPAAGLGGAAGMGGSGQWGEGQVEELFASLLGGDAHDASGRAPVDGPNAVDGGGRRGETVEVGQLRVFG